MSVYFHSSFNLDLERLSGILDCMIRKPKLNDEQIAGKFGYKTPFTKRYKSWLKKCGVIKNSIKVELTDYGEIIFEKDPNLEKETTLWYMHNYLTSSEENAESWHYFYNTFLPRNQSFSKLELSNSLAMKLMAHNPNHFAKNSPMIRVITKVLINSYVSDKAFGPLNIVEIKKGVLHRNKTEEVIGWNDVDSFYRLY